MIITDFISKDKESIAILEEMERIHQRQLKNGMYSDDNSLPTEIVIKPDILDTSALIEDNNKKHLWRPEKFDEYIGQENLKNIIKARINGCKKRDEIFSHMLIDGNAGSGKTTIAYLTAKYLDVPFVETVANTLQSPQQFVDKLSKAQGGIFFIDEIHEINKKVANFILPLLEDFHIDGKRIKKFTLFGCTTELGMLIKKYKPLVERMKIQKTLEDYTIPELVKIIKQFKEKTFSNENIDNDVYEIIANNCRNTPRMGLRILENYIFMAKPINEVLKAEGIVKNGFTNTDIKILQLLNEKEKGVGLNAISAFIGTSQENYLYKHENYLLQQGLITITTRRIITEKGKEFLKCI